MTRLLEILNLELARHPFVEKYKLPVVSTEFPNAGYLVAIYYPDHGYSMNTYQPLPTDEEMLVAHYYHQFKLSMWIKPFYIEEVEAKQSVFTYDFNTVILLKTTHGWKFSKPSFTGRGYFPVADEESCKDIVGLLDYVESNGFTNEKWNAYKEQFPEIFNL